MFSFSSFLVFPSWKDTEAFRFQKL
jgi:hypothetical protein